MRDPLLRRASAGLILALPVLIYITASSSDMPIGSAALAVGPIEAVLAAGLWFAARSRQHLCRTAARVSEPVGLAGTIPG